MKRLILFFLASSLSFGQSIADPQTALKTVNGISSPLSAATITVCPANSSGIPCTPATVAIFKDAALTQPLSNPFTSDAFGNYQFAAPAGQYTVTVTGVGFNGFSYQKVLPIAAFITNPGVFTNTQMNEYLKSSINGCNTATEQAAQPFLASNATSAISACLAGPTNNGSGNALSAIIAYATVNQPGGGGNAQAITGNCRTTANDSVCIGAGFAALDVLGSNTQMELVGASSGLRAPNPGSAYQFINGFLATAWFTGTGPYSTADAFITGSVTSTTWQNGFHVQDGTAAVGVNLGTTTAASGAAQSSPIRLNARNSGTTDNQFDIIAFAAAPSGTCTNNTLGVRVDNGATASTLLYVCLAGTSTWTAISIP